MLISKVLPICCVWNLFSVMMCTRCAGNNTPAINSPCYGGLHTTICQSGSCCRNGRNPTRILNFPIKNRQFVSLNKGNVKTQSSGMVTIIDKRITFCYTYCTVHKPLNLFETQTACCFCKEENTRIQLRKKFKIRGNQQSCQIPDISLCYILLLHFVALTFQRLLQ